MNADWIENLLTEFTPEINEKKAVITVKPPLMKENNVQATEPTGKILLLKDYKNKFYYIEIIKPLMLLGMKSIS